MKYFRINKVHTNLGFFNLKRFLRKKNQFFYTSLNGIVFPSMVLTTFGTWKSCTDETITRI